MLPYLYAFQWLVLIAGVFLLENVRRERDRKQNIIEAQEETLRMRNERIKLQDEVIAKQRELIETKMTHVVEQALTPKKKRKNV